MKRWSGLLITVPVGALLWILILYPVWAGGDRTTTNNYYTTDTPDVTNVTNLTDVSGLSDAEEEAIRGSVVAMCMGSSHFDYANGWQGSASGSWWKNEQAVCGAVGKRIDDILFTGALGCDVGFEDCGGVISGNWHF